MAIYNTYYENENYFGNPYPALVDFFRTLSPGTIVDLGAGQGRDSIPLARMGFSVTAVDESWVGIEQIKHCELTIHALVADIHSFDISSFDYILTDSMLHFYKSDVITETQLVHTILRNMKVGGIYINCLLKGKQREKAFADILASYPLQTLSHKDIDYPEHNATFNLTAVKNHLLVAIQE